MHFKPYGLSFRKKNRDFSAHFGPGGAVPPPRVSTFSKVQRSKTFNSSHAFAGDENFSPSLLAGTPQNLSLYATKASILQNNKKRAEHPLNRTKEGGAYLWKSRPLAPGEQRAAAGRTRGNAKPRASVAEIRIPSFPLTI